MFCRLKIVSIDVKEQLRSVCTLHERKLLSLYLTQLGRLTAICLYNCCYVQRDLFIPRQVNNFLKKRTKRIPPFQRAKNVIRSFAFIDALSVSICRRIVCNYLFQGHRNKIFRCGQAFFFSSQTWIILMKKMLRINENIETLMKNTELNNIRCSNVKWNLCIQLH